MEHVRDYPRPPAVEPCDARVVVEHGGEIVADTTRALRVLETTHPPGIYVPREDVRLDLLRRTSRTTVCEFKGRATYFDVLDSADAAWSYEDPVPRYAALRGHVSFYPGRVACRLGDEQVEPEASSFYGGWITSAIAL